MKKVILRPYFFCAVITALASLLTLQSCSGTHTHDNYGITAALDSIIDSEFQKDAPGAVIMVTHADTVIYSNATGLSRLDSVASLSENTMLNAASSTKTFTAAAILKLAEQGKLSLDDKLTDYFPNFNKDVFGGITLRHVLAHTSGIPDGRPANNEQWEKYITETASVFGYGPDFCIYGREKELTRFLESLDSLAFEPGTEFDRQDPPYMLLLSVIEQASGEPFEKWMKDNIFAPAGVTRFAYIDPSKYIHDMAHAYRRAEGPAKPKVFRSKDGRWEEYDYGEADFFLTRADRGLYISPADFTKALHALHAGKIISPESLALFHVPLVSTGNPGEGYSLGVNIFQDSSGLEKLYHRSTRGGFVTVEAAYPAKDVIYVIFSNRNDWDYNTFSAKVEEILTQKGLI